MQRTCTVGGVISASSCETTKQLWLNHSVGKTTKKRLGCDLLTGNTRSRFVFHSVHIFKLHWVFYNGSNEGSGSASCHRARCSLPSEHNEFPITQGCPGCRPGWLERDAWSLWSVSQQQTVHTSRRRASRSRGTLQDLGP